MTITSCTAVATSPMVIKRLHDRGHPHDGHRIAGPLHPQPVCTATGTVKGYVTVEPGDDADTIARFDAVKAIYESFKIPIGGAELKVQAGIAHGKYVAFPVGISATWDIVQVNVKVKLLPNGAVKFDEASMGLKIGETIEVNAALTSLPDGDKATTANVVLRFDGI